MQETVKPDFLFGGQPSPPENRNGEPFGTDSATSRPPCLFVGGGPDELRGQLRETAVKAP
jgi:hypothetical protein